MPLDRYGCPGLLGAIDAGYVIAGRPELTAAASRGSAHGAEHLSADQEAEQAVAEAEAEAAAAERAAQQYATFGRRPDPAPSSDDLVSRLEDLARLRDRGALSQSEYETAKTRLLSS
jgi:Short C-terminal domain